MGLPIPSVRRGNKDETSGNKNTAVMERPAGDDARQVPAPVEDASGSVVAAMNRLRDTETPAAELPGQMLAAIDADDLAQVAQQAALLFAMPILRLAQLREEIGQEREIWQEHKAAVELGMQAADRLHAEATKDYYDRQEANAREQEAARRERRTAYPDMTDDRGKYELTVHKMRALTLPLIADTLEMLTQQYDLVTEEIRAACAEKQCFATERRTAVTRALAQPRMKWQQDLGYWKSLLGVDFD